MSSIVLDKDIIFADEIIRENARLTVQHEADLLRADQLAEELEEAKAAASSAQEALEACARAQEQACTAEVKLAQVNTSLTKAIEDLHFVMAGGNACKVCTRRCTFGTGECRPIWRGEETEAEG